MSRSRLSSLSSRSKKVASSLLLPVRVVRRRVRTRSQLLLIGLLSLLVFAGLLSGWGLLLRPTSAASHNVRPGAPASNTFQQFLKGGQQSKAYHGPLTYSAMLPKHKQVPQSATSTTTATPPPSTEPPTMQPIAQALSAAFLQGGPTSNASPLDLLGSDGRLEVQVQPGSFDISHATVGAGAPPSGTLSLQVTQLQGYFVGQSVSLGFYQLQLLDSNGQALSGVQVRTPLTILYHYQPAELDALGLDPGRVLLAFPDLIAAATQATASPAAYETPMQNDPTANTLSAQSTVLGPHPFSLVSEPQNQSLPTLHLASMQGNNGQLTYSYPLQVPPGPGGFTPQLQLTYSSAGPNERHVANSPAGSAGDGWSLSLGSISEETYGTNPGTTYYFINDVAGVGDRLVPTGSNNLYDTQHISDLRIQQTTGAGGQLCFDVWDKSGTFYEIGCTTNSLQYWMDTNGVRHNYQWDVDKIIAPNEGPSASTYRLMLLTYAQDTASNNGHTYVRDSALQQLIYGIGSTNSITTVVGTVDLFYHGPTASNTKSGDSNRQLTVTAYGTNYGSNCQPPNHLNTTLRCDDPLNDGSSELAPLVMSTLTLDSVASYVGSDAGTGSSYEDYSYSLAYNSNPTQAPADTPFAACTDPLTLAQEYCAGEHLLYSITPTVYQNNAGSQLHPVDFTYTTLLQNTYYDSTEKINGGPNYYTAQNNWSYLSAYEDLNTGVGESIAWKRAYSNTDGTPDKYNQGVLIDDRHDPLYCTNYPSDCTGNYAHPDNQAWSEQVVVSISTLGKDSSASYLQNATTTYSYLLAITGTYPGNNSQYCYPTSSDSDCVGDDWISALKQDWQDYYHAEYQGFAQVAITSPAGDLTVDKYNSTKGWYTAWSDPANFLGGSLNEEDAYFGSSINNSSLLRKIVNTYGANSNACRNASLTYPACEVVLDSAATTDYELQGSSNPNAPWVQQTYTYDDYSDQYGLSTGYHNLLEDVTSSANASSITHKWSYTTNDQTTTSPSWTYYTVDAVTHSEVDDSTGHVWQCQNTTYDEHAPSGTKIPAEGLPTTSTSYGNCAAQTTPVTTYQDYDQYGNLVASVDGVASANSSLYTSNGCTLTTSPYIYSSSWGNTHYTACSTYDTTYNTLPLMQTNALGQLTTLGYTSEDVLASVTDANNKTATDSYSYSGGNTTLQISQPGETNSYTTRSVTATSCTYNTGGNELPCYETDSNAYLYNTVKSSTYYDSLGRAVETRTPGPGSGYDTLIMTIYNDQAHTSWQSVPFEVTHGSGWIDPNGATDYQGVTPGGTTTYYDPLGRAVATQDPNFGSSQEPGYFCSAYFYGNFTDCANYELGTASGDSHTYLTSAFDDPNQHLSLTYLDALGRSVYTQQDSGPPPTLNAQTAIVYNVLNEPTSVSVTDEAPQSGQSITSVTTSAQYDDLGRLTTLTDPDRGTHAYFYDADGHVLTDTSGTRTIGYSYDLLGRVGCVQDRAATISPTGACTSGANVSVKNFYDITELGTQGSTDFPIGHLTKSDTTTHYTDGTSATVSVAYQHDVRGRLIDAHMSFPTLPSSWNITSALPSYKVQYSYNDANQPTTTATSTSPSGQGTTTTQVYDSTSGILTGLSNNGSASANLATLVYNARAQLDTLNFQTSSGTALLAEQFGYDANLRTTSATASWQSGSGSSGSAFSQGLTYDAASNLTSLSTTQASVPGQSNSGGSETQVFCYDEQNRLVWAGNSGTPSCSGNGTPSVSGHLAAYSASYAYTHLGQLWQAPLNGGSTQQQYLYCSSASSNGTSAAPTRSSTSTTPTASASCAARPVAARPP